MMETRSAKGPGPDIARWALPAALLFALLAAWPLVNGPGLVNTRAGGDSPFLLVRVQQLVEVLRAGGFPPRWMPDAAYGLGYPFFNHYAALPYYLAAALKFLGLGYLAAIQLTQAFGFLAAALGMYALVRHLTHSPASAFLAAVAYTYAPFHLVNVYVRGDSLSEFYAFAFYPLILWCLARLHDKLAWRRAAWVALAYAGLILTHNVSALIFSPFIALFILILFITQAERRWRWALYGAAALAGGVVLSAWFWWPALMERGLGHMADMTTGYFHYSGHFRGWDLLQRSLGFDYAITADRTPFVMGLAQALLILGGVAATVWLAWRRRSGGEGRPGYAAFALLAFAAATWMITPLSRPLWEHIPLLPMIQFPWRFLSVQSLGGALLIGQLARPWPRRPWLALLVGGAILWAGLAHLQPERLHIQESDVTPERLALYELFTGNIGTTVRYEYLPQWVEARPMTSEALARDLPKGAPLVVDGMLAEAALVSHGPGRETWDIQVTSPAATLAFQTYYFPGWRATVDGQAVEVRAQEGLGYLRLDVPQGAHRVALAFGGTRSRRLVEAASLLAALAAAAVIVWRHPIPPRLLRAAGGTLAALLLAALALRLWPAASAPERTWSDLSMDFARQPYLHHNPTGLSFGGEATLAGYRLSSAEVAPGEAIEVALEWEGATAAGLEAELRLVSFAEPLFQVSDPLAQQRLPLGNVTPYALTVPERAVPGLYLLSLRVWDGEGELPPLNDRGETLGVTYLQPVRVRGGAAPAPTQGLVAEFGACIALTEAQASQQGAQLAVDLRWTARCPALRNYALSVRLKDVEGRQVAARDIQPHDGFYPTSYWQPGEVVPDRVLLDLPPGTPPASDYALELVLYQSDTLQALGVATVPGIALTQPSVTSDYAAVHRFAPDMELAAAALLAAEIEEGQPVVLQATWAAPEAPARDYACRLAARPAAGEALTGPAQRLAPAYATPQWPPHALVSGTYRLADLAAGSYSVALELLDAQTGESLGAYTLPQALTVKARARAFEPPPMQTALAVALGGKARLLGYDLEQSAEALRLTLYWQGLARMETDYTVFIHLLDPAQDKIVAQRDAAPGAGAYPTTLWAEGEVVRDEHILPLAGVPSGAYRLVVGLYHPQTWERLAPQAEGEVTISDGRVFLPAEIRVP